MNLSSMNLEKEQILIIGGTGSLGRALIKRLVLKNKLALFSRDEAKHWTIKNQLPDNATTEYFVGDIRDSSRLEEAMMRFQPSIIIIAAALKQVDTCELSPDESIQTNIMGVNNVLKLVQRWKHRLEKLRSALMVSTDKACAPANVYGMCKAIGERLVTSMGLSLASPKFVGVRYGNVLESRGSIIPLFRYQAENLGGLTVTHPEMTRFVMTLDQSIDLIINTLKGADTGEIWIPKLKSMRIGDLAQIFSERYKKPVVTVGIRPGEKMHEELISESESIRAREEEWFFKLRPPCAGEETGRTAFRYTSRDDVMSKLHLEKYLQSIGIFEKPLSQFSGLEIEEIKISEIKR